MNLVQLKYFHAVCISGSVSAAAASLYISQPSVSGAIKELEREFGITLFKRHHRGMVLTPEGEVLYKMSRDLLSRAEQLEEVMGDLGNERKTLRLGVPPMIGSLILTDIYRDFYEKNPEIMLQITEGGRNELMSLLSEDFLDMVFLPHNRPFESKFAYLEVAQLEIVCCVSDKNPVSKLKAVSAADLANVPLVLFKNSFFQTEEIKKWFQDSGVVPNILLQTEQVKIAEKMIGNNLVAGFLFRRLAEDVPELKAVPIQAPMFEQVSLVWKKDSYMFNAMKKFCTYIREKIFLKR